MKSDKAEIARRIEEVLRIIVDGAEFHDIVQFASEKGWGVGERQLWNYVKKANELLAKRMERDRDKLLARHIGQRRNLYARAVNAADYRTALAVAQDEAKLENLYPPTKIAPTDPTGVEEYGRLSADEQQAGVDAIVSAVGNRGGGAVQGEQDQPDG